jgi:acyl transferase domain-containing protein
MSGRFPRARNVEEFWRNLCEGVECISTFSAEELKAAGIDPAVMSNPNYVNRGGVVEDADMFDAQFFGFSPREAETIDPQHRLFLECAVEGLEHAGYDPDQFEGLIGVYAGSSLSTYALHLYLSRNAGLESFDILLGNDKDYVATRTAYKLNLRGPALTVQTACSTSLVAVCIAVQALRNFDCDMALAGGVTINVPQNQGYFYREGGIASPDGHCRSFDAQAKGIVAGNGVAILVLRRLSDALAAGDQIHAVIKGAAINNDGAAKVGFTAPSIQGQAEVIATSLAQAGFAAETIGYVEAHGTATPLGDPIEITALTQAFGGKGLGPKTCPIGSVKSNVGHLDAAAGATGLIKAVLAVKHGEIPKSLHFETPNPQIDFANSPFFVNTQHRTWPSDGLPRRAGVSSFGIGGTNAHVVLEQAPPPVETSSSLPVQVVTLSGRTAPALEAAKANLADHLTNAGDGPLDDVAFTCHVGRKAFAHRCAVVCRNRDEAVAALRGERSDLIHGNVCGQTSPQVAFMLPGQGTQYAGMGRDLYEQVPHFRATIDRCIDYLGPFLAFDLRRAIYLAGEVPDDAEEHLAQTSVAQPALFVIEYALASLWMHWGIKPYGMIGHSVGELVAACLSGVFTLEDALEAVAARGRIMQEMPRGAMAAVPLGEEKVRALLADGLSLAAVNAPSSCTVAGPIDAVDRFAAKLALDGHSCTRLRTSHAFHSELMEEAARRFSGFVKQMNLGVPTIPFVSNRSGGWITPEQATDPAYWGAHIRDTVRFRDGLQTLAANPDALLLEVGPGAALTVLAGAARNSARRMFALPSLPGARSRQLAIAAMTETLGKLWTTGVGVNWPAFHAHERRRRLELPTYPFQRQRYWLDPAPAPATVPDSSAGRQADIANWFYAPTWTRTPAPATPRLEDAPGAARALLLFADDVGLCADIAGEFRSAGWTVIEVRPGPAFAQISATDYAIDPRSEEDYARLVQTLDDAGFVAEKVIHAWSVTNDGATNGGSARTFDDIQELGFYSLLWLAKALVRARVADQIEIVMLSNDMHVVVGNETIMPEKSTMLAACRGIPQEYPNVRIRSVDVQAADARASGGALGKRIFAEAALAAADPVVAYRADRRWVQSYLPYDLGPARDPPTLLRRGGVYVITGGLGEIGLRLAEELARTCAAKLVLIGRTPIPAKEDWDSWLAAQAPADPTSRKIAALRQIERLGGEVLALGADIADGEAGRAALDQAVDRFGAVHGIFHGAGITAAHGYRMLQDVDRALCEEHFRSKAHGAQVLRAFADGRKLDFIVLMSSISSILAGLGFIPYAASNLYLDALAEHENRNGRFPWISINWDGWDFRSMPESSASAPVIYSDEGLEAFRRILTASPAPQVVVAAGDLHYRQMQWLSPMDVQEHARAAGSTGSQHERPTLSSDYVAPTDDVEEAIADIWRTLMGISRIGIHDNFFELGGHSLLGIQVISRLRETFRVEISVRNIFDGPTIAELAATIKSGLPMAGGEAERIARTLDHVERMSEEELRLLVEAQRTRV